MPRPKQAIGTTADPRNGARHILAVADGVPKCPMPERLALDGHPVVVEAWTRFWRDPISAILQETDYMLLERYFTALDRYFKLSEQADEQPICKGSQGQDVLNPMYQAANMSLLAAERLEKQLGIGPSNRSRLGIELVAAGRAGRQFEPTGPDPDDGRGGTTLVQAAEERRDPREAGRE